MSLPNTAFFFHTTFSIIPEPIIVAIKEKDMSNSKTLLFALLTLFITPVTLAEDKHHHSARVYIISPADGETVTSPVKVIFGLSGMGVAPAGVDNKGAGHHHLLVDASILPAMDQPIPSDDHHRHFGKGQTETLLFLEPGKHTLQLILGDKDHIPVSQQMISDKITITVE
jgi:hypothetical protein